MTFIRLAHCVINSSKITYIRIFHKKYQINMSSSSFDGFHSGFSGFSIGLIGSNTEKFDICEITNKHDYDIMTNWINTHTISTDKPK